MRVRITVIVMKKFAAGPDANYNILEPNTRAYSFAHGPIGTHSIALKSIAAAPIKFYSQIQ